MLHKPSQIYGLFENHRPYNLYRTTMVITINEQLFHLAVLL